MDAAIKKLPETSQVQLSVTVAQDEFRSHLDKAAKKLSEATPIKGFRPGKVTLQVALETYGHERVINEAVNTAVPRFFVEAVLDREIEALGRPATTIERAGLEEGLVFTAIVDVMPEVTLGDVAAITVESRPIAINVEAVDKELTYIAKTRSTYLDVARPAQEGDTVRVDFKVSMDGAVMEGGESKNHPVHIGEGYFVPDFEQKIRGMQAQEEREFSILFPEDFAATKLRGKTAQVWVKAHSVQKRVLPTIDDAFAKSLGTFENLAALKTELQKNMQLEQEQREHERVQGEIMEKLAGVSTFGAIPKSLIEREIDRRLTEFNSMLGTQKKTLEQYLAEHKKTPAELREEFRPASEKSVKVSLALRQFSLDQKITVSDEEIEREATAFLRQYGSAKEAAKDTIPDELRTSMESTLRNQKAIARLEEMANVQAAPVTAPQATKPA